MDVIHSARMDWNYVGSGIRGADRGTRELFVGQPGSVDNYWYFVSCATQADRDTPRHRHTFDQIRYVVRGRKSISPNNFIEPRQLNYISEGTHYGPQTDPPDVENETLVMQFAGASGLGFLSQTEIKAAAAELRTVGRFEKGVFVRETGEGRKNQDAYEAVWEHVNGRKIKYPGSRYGAPITINPDHFEWTPVVQGVQRKLLGVFSEREFQVSLIGLAPGAIWRAPADNAVRLMFTLSGEGDVGSSTYERFTAVRLAYREEAQYTARTESEILVYALPPVPADRRQGDSAKLASAAE